VSHGPFDRRRMGLCAIRGQFLGILEIDGVCLRCPCMGQNRGGGRVLKYLVPWF
jgi:hypothetical protein